MTEFGRTDSPTAPYTKSKKTMIVVIDSRQFGPWKNLILVKPGIRKRHLQGDTRMKALIWIFSAVMLAACGTAEHSVRVEDEQAFTADTKVIVTQVTNKTGESFDIDIEAMLKDAMVTELVEQNLLGQPGIDNVLSMEINIIEYRKGDAFKRWLWPGYGSTVLVVEATLLDNEGNTDATAQANRSVDAGGGYTIGAWSAIFQDVASDLIADLKGNIRGSKSQ